MKKEKTPELTELNWRRVAWGGALVEALARQCFVVEKARKGRRRDLSRGQ